MQRKILSVIVMLFTTTMAWSQINEALIDLGKTFRKSPDLSKYDSTEFAFTRDFVQESIRFRSDILSEKYLRRPGDQDLLNIYIVRQVNLYDREPKYIKNLEKRLVDGEVSTYALLHNYYSMIFSTYGNIKPYDMSKINFELHTLGLKDDTEKGIFFLASMQLNNAEIWGYMNIVKPPNYQKAYENIILYPRYNGLPYYQFMNLDFSDFKMKIEKEKDPESYKGFHLNKYYETLVYHVACLKNRKDEQGIRDLVTSSILNEEGLFRYSKEEKFLKKLRATYK